MPDMASIRKQASGTWRVSVKHKGHRRTATAATQAAAKDLGRQFEDELAAIAGTSLDRPTVATIVAHRRTLGGWAPTLASEHKRAAGRIPPELAAKRADRVRVPDVERAYRIVEQTHGAHAARRVHELLRASYSEAVRVGAVGRSPMLEVRQPARPPADVVPPSADDVAAILAAVDGGELVALRLAAATGARRGEVVALQWDSVDFESGTVAIVASLAYTKDAGVHERPTKTGKAGQRVVTVDRETIELLRRHRRSMRETVIAHRLPPPRYVLSDDGGVTPWRPDRLTKVFGRARVAAGVEGVHLHGLRHFHATQLLAAGEPVRRVSYRLGHTSTATTERIYAHWIPGEDAGAAAIMGTVLGGTQ